MSDETPKQSDPDKGGSIDLSSLQELSFGPAWTESSGSNKKESSGRTDTSGRARSARAGATAQRKDRRMGGKPERSKRFKKPEEFVPTVDVQLYPEDGAFEKLANSIRLTCRTYELFEIARVILEKPERYVAFISHKDGGTDKSAGFFVSVPDGLTFQSEDDVANHIMRNHLDMFFEAEETEVDPPKGNFTFIQKCPVSGDLIGPPNYHRFPNLLREQHAAKASHIPFERYQTKLEKVTDEETIQAWVQSMTKQIRYKPKSDPEAELLEGLEAARHYLLSREKDRIVKFQNTVRIPGTDVEKIDDGDLKRSIEAVRQKQLKFPLETANNLRARLRRLKFNIYKKGSKGVSYVSAVKRKFREPSTVFSDSLQKLIEFIDQNQNISIKKLPKAYLDIELPSSDDSGGGSALSAENDATLKQMMQDLRWLVTEGYVTEFGDTTLFAPPPMTHARPKGSAASSKRKPSKSETPSVEAVKEPADAEPASEHEAATPESAEESLEEQSVVAEEEPVIVVEEAPVVLETEEPPAKEPED